MSKVPLLGLAVMTVLSSLAVVPASGDDGPSASLFASSVDAMAMWPNEFGIRFATYGHSPAVPVPASSPVALAWSAAATVPGTLGGPAFEAPLDTDVDLAFDRDGNVWAVWTRLEPQMFWQPCAPEPYPDLKGRIMVSRYDGATRTWSAPFALTGPYASLSYDRDRIPSIAVDVNGFALAVWFHDHLHDHGTCDAPNTHIHSDVWYATFGGAWSGPATVPGGSEWADANPAVAFLAQDAPGGSASRSEAVVVWEDASSLDPDTGFALTDRLHFAAWSGGGFGSAGSIAPDAPGSGRKLDVAALRGGNALVGYDLSLADGPHSFGNVYSASLDGFVGPVVDAGVDSMNSAVTVEPNNDGHLFYTKFDGAGNPKVHDRLSPGGTSWTMDAIIGDLYASAAASVHHGRILVGGVGPTGQGLVNAGAGWADANIPEGAHHALSAHTGSPNLPHAEWTYAVYASNMVAPFLPLRGAGSDSAEMQVVGSSARLNGLLFFKDGPSATRGVRREMPGAETPLEAKYEADTGRDVVGFVPNFGHPTILQEWAAWVSEAYPAVRTGLDFWDHGEGWGGGNFDDAGGGDHLTMPEYRAALSGGLGTRPVDLLVFSECAMAQLEVAYEVRSWGAYMIASEDCMPGDGLEYEAVYDLLQRTPQPLLPILVGEIISDYDARYGVADAATLSGTNLALVAALATALDGLADALTGPGVVIPPGVVIYPLYVVNHPNLDAARQGAQTTAVGCSVRGCSGDYVDLWHFADRIRTQFGAATPIGTQALAVRNAVVAAVSPVAPDHEYHEPLGLQYHGLTVYFERTGAQWTANAAIYGALRLSADTDFDLLVSLYAPQP